MKNLLFLIGFLFVISCNPKQQTTEVEQPTVDSIYLDGIVEEQTALPSTTLKLANPRTLGNKYVIDVMVIGSVPKEVLGINVRLFYESKYFSNVVVFKNFQGGYTTGVFGQPRIYTGLNKDWFGFSSPARFLNGSCELTKQSAEDILLDPTMWKKLFEIEFTIISSEQGVCYPIVLDKKNKDASFLPGSEGIVIVLNQIGGYTNASVQHWNWEQTQQTPPFGKVLPCVTM